MPFPVGVGILTANNTRERMAGILCHVTSLPGGDGSGTLGRHALAFVDALAGSGFDLWQVLPLNPTDEKGSPYLSASAFACNTTLIDLDELAGFGFEPTRRLERTARVDVRAVAAYRARIDGELVHWFRVDPGALPLRRSFGAFVARNAGWLDDFALFSVLHRDVHDRAPWWRWEADIRDRCPKALAGLRARFSARSEGEKILQYLCHRQWRAVKARARAAGVRVLGDLPIYVSADSADVWANPGLFLLDDRKEPLVRAGVPPDYFCRDGQLWGNPIYDWRALADTGFDWWKRRIARAAELYDLVRIDHFRAFADFWAVPKGAATAREGTWRPGPGAALLNALREVVALDRLVAEDLGHIDERVLRLRDEFGLAGMAVVQFGCDGNADNPHHFRNHAENTFAYLSTHDNATSLAWLSTLDPWHRAQVADAVDRPRDASDRGLLSALMERTMASRAGAAVICLQDVLGLGDEATMNRPGRADGNWAWRVAPGTDLAAALGPVGRFAIDSGRSGGRAPQAGG